MSRFILVTDGSAISNENGGFDSASAFAIYLDNELIYTDSVLLLNHTNNYAEMYAIYRGTKYIIEHLDYEENSGVLIITDSQLCEKTLNEWMSGWLKKATNEVLMSTTGKVKNQELIKSAYINILTLALDMSVFVCHINSHNSESKIPEMYKKFTDKYFHVDMDEFKLIFEGNQLVDKLAYDELNKK